MKRITKRIVGVVLIILGLAALLTPLSPGSWLILSTRSRNPEAKSRWRQKCQP
jgi:hypothetical protein